MSFTPQKVINAARRRHPALSTVLLDDEQIVDDFNAAVDEVVAKVLEHNEMLLAAKSDSLAITGADDSQEDLNFTTGELLRILDMDCTKSAARKKVILKDLRHRDTIVAEFTDDGRPVGSILWNPTNGRWDIWELTGWTGVTALWAYGVFKPTKVTTASLVTAMKVPESFFLPLTTYMALLLGQRADLDQGWVQIQGQAIASAVSGLVGKTVKFSEFVMAAPKPGQPAAARQQ